MEGRSGGRVIIFASHMYMVRGKSFSIVGGHFPSARDSAVPPTFYFKVAGRLPAVITVVGAFAKSINFQSFYYNTISSHSAVSSR